MRKLTLALAFVGLTAAPSFAAVRGAWTAYPRDEKDIQINLTLKASSHMNDKIALADLAGLTNAAINANVQTPVTFELRREAGNVSFEGTFKEGFGAGQFSFAVNPQYVTALRNLGVRFDDPADEEEYLIYATQDVSSAFIRSMQAEGYREPAADTYMQMRIFKVTPDLVRELRGLGFDKISADDLVATRIHKVTPDYIRAMRAAGYTTASLDDLVATRIHKATPEFAAEMKALGYANLSLDDLVTFRIHKVTAEFIKELRELGYTNIPAERLVEMRIHRVTPQFIRELKDAGYEHIPIEKLVEMRIQGIDADFVKKMSRQ